MAVRKSTLVAANTKPKIGVFRRAARMLTVLPASQPKVHRRVSPEVAAQQKQAEKEDRQIAFTLAVISLSAKLAKADGAVSESEFLAFRALFPIQESEEVKIRRLFDQACAEAVPFEIHALHIVRLFPGRKSLLAELLDRMFRIAIADGPLSLPEALMLKRLAGVLGFTAAEYRKIHQRHVISAPKDPYQYLNISPKASDAELKRHYRLLMKQYHPDTLRSAGLGAQELKQAHRRVVAINEAYDMILRKRGLKRAVG